MPNAVLPQMFDCYYDNFVQFLIQCENHVLPLQMLAFYLAVTYPAEIDAHLNHPEISFKLKKKQQKKIVINGHCTHETCDSLQYQWNSIELTN